MIRQNPVLHRESLLNLRSGRSFGLFAVYLLVLTAVVLLAWPREGAVDLSGDGASAGRLTELFFLSQLIGVAMLAPSFAAGTIAGEKERRTYEMLLASPVPPGRIVLGKFIATQLHLVLFIVASLPIVVLCLPLGGVSVYEVLAAYLGLVLATVLFGSVSVLCSSLFSRTTNALIVSYLIILPLAIAASVLWRGTAGDGEWRIRMVLFVLPGLVIPAVLLMAGWAASRMLYPPDFGSEGRQVFDPAAEAEQAVGLVIQPDQFPDSLFAPPPKESLMADGANPVYDKEIHAEIFSQGTLMLRLVIQISMLLAIPMMGVFLFWQTQYCIGFACFVIVFNLLVGPVFLAPTVTGERERQTLDLLMTTTLSPSAILIGKFVAGFRVSGVLTSFLVWPLLLGVALNSGFYSNLPSAVGMAAIIATVTVVNAAVALAASLTVGRTTTALLLTYAVLATLYIGPLAIQFLFGLAGLSGESLPWLGSLSPFAALMALPWDGNLFPPDQDPTMHEGRPGLVAAYLVGSPLLVALLAIWMRRRLRTWAEGVGQGGGRPTPGIGDGPAVVGGAPAVG